MNDKKTSPWVWVGCGCAVLAFLGIAGIGGLTWFGVRTARDIADPEKSRSRALELLGAEALPAGYTVQLAVDLPFSVELVALEGEGRELVYMRGIGRSHRLDDFADGTLDLVDLLEESGVRFDDGEIVTEDRETFGALEADWVVYRGDVDLQEVQGGGHGEFTFDDAPSGEGLTTVTLLRCPGDRKLRLGIWRGPDPDPAVAPGQLQLTGSVGDPQAVRDLFGSFHLCD